MAVAIFHAKFVLFGPALHFDKEGWKQRISQGRHHQRSALMRRVQVAEKLMQASVCNLLSFTLINQICFEIAQLEVPLFLLKFCQAQLFCFSTAKCVHAFVYSMFLC